MRRPIVPAIRGGRPSALCFLILAVGLALPVLLSAQSYFPGRWDDWETRDPGKVGMDPRLVIAAVKERTAGAMSGAPAPAIPARPAPDLDGTWSGETEVPGVGLTEITLVLKKLDKGYSGTIASGNQAVISGSPEIKDMTADGEKLEFVFPLADGTLLLMKLDVAGEKMTGHWEHPAGSTGAVGLAKKK